jgi:dimeric dUTPase (all-alpha-NTP-PPase superfamily)
MRSTEEGLGKSIKFSELLKLQEELDKAILLNNPVSCTKEEMINHRMMALSVEVSEMANEHRGFKYWSKKGPSVGRTKEEYIDVLHFVLSLGNDLFEDSDEIVEAYLRKRDINFQRQLENY